MAVDVGISHMTLLIVTLAFSLVNICLIIATGGIIYNWQDRFMGPVLKCDQPKWTSDGKDSGNVRAGWTYAQNWGNTGYGYGSGSGYSSQAVTYGVSASGVVGSSSWSSWKDSAWSTCPYIQYPRWSTWTQPTTTWTTWTQPTAWVSWTQPTAWVAWTQPTAWVAAPTAWIAAPTTWIAAPTAWIAAPTAWVAWSAPGVVITGK